MPEAVARVEGFPAPVGPLDLVLHAGDILHVRGPNGSGKTSLLRAFAGLPSARPPQQVLVQGDEPATVPAARLAARVRWSPHDPRDGLVGLTVAGEFRLRGHPLPQELLALADRDVARLSSGEARRVALGVAAAPANPPALLLLDEPADALDAQGLAWLTRLVQQASRSGGVVVTDHTGWAARVANRSLDLAPASLGNPLSRLPVLVGPTILQAPARQLERDGGRIHLPAIRFGPGLHAVTGANGAGKSTLLERLAGLRNARDVRIEGQPPEPGRTVRLLQPDAGARLGAGTVAEELEGIADPTGLAAGIGRQQHPLSLSAGEAHRIALAKVLGRPARVYLLDEPEAHLDGDGRARLLRALAARAEAGACVVAATHDPHLQTLAQDRIEVRP